MEKILVVGANHAGTYAINTIVDNYKDVSVTAYDSNDNISFLGCGMALWIGNQIDSYEGLFYETPENLAKKGVNVNMETLVKNVDFNNKTVTIQTKDGNESEDTYDKLILGIGSMPVKPPIKGIDLENIIYAKFLADAQKAKKMMDDENLKRIAVVGGGYIGVELVEAFKRHGKEVVLITNDRVLNNYYDEEFTNPMRDNLQSNGVKVAENESVVEFVGNDGKVTKVVTDKNEYDVDVVLMSVGFKPNTDFLKDTDLKLDNRGAIVVNSQQQTNIKDVYAIGDCTDIYSNSSEQDQYIALATNAVRTGIIAGHNAMGKELKLNGVQGSNAISIYGLNLTSTGLNSSSAIKMGYDIDSVIVTDNIRPEFMKENYEVTIRVVWDKKTLRILGSQIMSTYDITLATHMFSLAIENGYTVDKLATLDLFFLPHFNKPENFITKAGLEILKKL